MQIDVVTILGLISVIAMGYLVYRVSVKSKTDVGTAVHLILLKELQLIFLILIVLFSFGQATFAASIHPPDDLIQINGFARYIVHGGIEFTSAICFIYALNLFAHVLEGIPKDSPFGKRISKVKASTKPTSNRYKKVIKGTFPLKLQFWTYYGVMLVFLFVSATALAYYNTYLIAGGLREIQLFTDFLKAILNGDNRVANVIFSKMSYAMQASTVSFFAHMLVIVVDGSILAFRMHVLGVSPNHLFGGAEEKSDKKEKTEDGKEDKKDEKESFKKDLNYILGFIGNNAKKKADEIERIWRGQEGSNMFAISSTITRLNDEIKNYYKNDKDNDKDGSKKSRLISKIISELQASPDKGGVGLTLPKN